MNSHPPEHQSQHRSQPGMNPPSTPSNPMHVPQPPRHPLHTSAIGYPIFDPYSAMIVNHSNNSVHPFAPK
ncbi:fem-1 A-like protein [Sarcoptes scabiei]|nr:fem-1 A-like protein [Sarcoptes scabiei]